MNKKKNFNVLKFLSVLFLIFGLGYMIPGLAVSAGHSAFMKDAVPVEAEIIEITTERYRTNGKNKTRHDITISFEHDGRTIKQQLNEYDSSMYEGQIIEVYVSPEGKARTEFSVITVVFISLGAAFTVTGVILLIVSIKNDILRKKLIENGERLTGTISAVHRVTNIRINGRHPFKAECEVTDIFTGEKYLFSSRAVTKDISYLIGRDVTIYTEHDDRSKYYVDIDEAIKSASDMIHDFR